MERKNKCKNVGFSVILWAVTAVVLCAAPLVQADEVPVGAVWDIPSTEHPGPYWFLTVLGTANILSGAVIEYDLEANAGSQVNIRGGSIGDGAWFGVMVSIDSPPAVVTVYGTEFEDSTGPITDSSWTPDSGGEVLSGKYEGGVAFSIMFKSDFPIKLAPPGTTNLPPVAIAGQEGLIGPGGKIHPIYSSEQKTTMVLGQASDPEEEPIEYRWLEGTDVLLDWTAVTTVPEAYLDLSTLPPFSLGDHTLVLEVREESGDMLESMDDMTLRILGSLTIDIKPGSYLNIINLGSNGVVPVAILSTADFDATDPTLVNPDNVFLAGSGVAVRGKGNNILAHEEDVNEDGFVDLVVKVETENLDPGTFQNGGAFLQIRETSDPGSPIINEGWDEITIVPPE